MRVYEHWRLTVLAPSMAPAMPPANRDTKGGVLGSYAEWSVRVSSTRHSEQLTWLMFYAEPAPLSTRLVGMLEDAFAVTSTSRA